MKSAIITAFLLLTCWLVACTRQTQQKSTEDILVVDEVLVQEVAQVDPPPPPPPPDKIKELSSHFETLQQWLSYLCSKEKPAKKISTFSFMFYECANKFLLTVVGTNRGQNKKYSYLRDDFQPQKWFLLSQKKSKNLTNEQIKEDLALQLQAFTQTDQFKKSFFEKADSIDLDGAVVWRKN